MVPDSAVLSPSPKSPTFRKPHTGEFGSCSVLLERHRFLLTTMALLAVLCTVYLYFAITLGAGEACSGLTGAVKASCRLEVAKGSGVKGKLKLF